MRILCVDDDTLVRLVTGDMLRELDHDVLEAPDALLALEWLKKSTVPIDVLLTDIRMPGMTGLALARRAVREQPDLAIIYMTGFGEGLALSGPVLSKTCTMGSLKAAIANLH